MYKTLIAPRLTLAAAFSAGLSLGLAGCASNEAKLPQPPDTKPAQAPRVAPQRGPTGAPVQQSDAAASDDPIAPPGSQYTIFAARIDGEMHVERANRMKKELRASTKMKDWYTVHQEGQSLLYYGFYKSVDDPKNPDSARATNDRRKIDQMQDPAGNRPFQLAMLVALDAPDPAAPPEWNLATASGTYTIHIGTYKGSADRKQFAVDAVRAAREQGIPAYYYHGQEASIVCIGTWPETAVRVNNEAVQRGNDQQQPLLYVPPSSDPKVIEQYNALAKSRGARIVRAQFEVVDPTLLAMLKQFPYSSVNGMTNRRLVDGQEDYDHSIVIKIPRDENWTRMAAEQQSPDRLPLPSSPGSIFGASASRPPGPSQPPSPAANAGQPSYDPSYRPDLPRVLDTPQRSRPTGAVPGQLRSIGE